MKLKTLAVSIIFVLPTILNTTGCATAVIAGAAAAGGYIAHEKGYRVRNPVVKEGEKNISN